MTGYLIQFYTKDGRLWQWMRTAVNGNPTEAATQVADELPNAKDFQPCIITVGYVH